MLNNPYPAQSVLCVQKLPDAIVFMYSFLYTTFSCKFQLFFLSLHRKSKY